MSGRIAIIERFLLHLFSDLVIDPTTPQGSELLSSLSLTMDQHFSQESLKVTIIQNEGKIGVVARCLKPGGKQSVDLVFNQEGFPLQRRQEKNGGNLQRCNPLDIETTLNMDTTF